MGKKVICILVSLIMMFSNAVMTVSWAKTSNSSVKKSATCFAGGDGTASNPYQIETPDQLNEIRSYLGNHFILNDDIDLSTSYKTENWTPIVDFYGSIDGNGKKIKGLVVDMPTNVQTNAGFIANFTSKDLYCGIKNLNFENVSVKGFYAGGIVGFSMRQREISEGRRIIKNCTVSGEVTSAQNNSAGNGYAGGLAANLNFTAIENCEVSNMKIICGHGGGIAAEIYSCSVQDSSFSGTLESAEGQYANLGGISGECESTVIKGCNTTISASGGQSMGGICGMARRKLEIIGCITNGTLRKTTFAGGIIGYTDGVSSIQGCKNKINISDSEYAGGITTHFSKAGYTSECSNYNLSKCENYGTINASKDAGGILNTADSEADIISCINYGTVTGGELAGGIISTSKKDNWTSRNPKIINCDNFSRVEGTNAGAIAGSAESSDDESKFSHCGWAQGDSATGEGTAKGTYRIGETSNSKLISGEVKSLNSKYQGEITLVPISSSDNNVISVSDNNKLRANNAGNADITYNVTLNKNNQQIKYQLTQQYQVLEKGIFSEGDGSADSPYVIKTEEDLNNISQDLYANYIINNDIETTKPFTPIGDISSPFMGNINGNTKTIKNLRITKYTDYAGLVGFGLDAKIQNLSLENAYISTGQYAGGIGGYTVNSNISDIVVNGEITSTSVRDNYSGLIVGYAINGEINNACGLGDVKSAYAGVFAGYANTELNNCYWYGQETEEGIGEGEDKGLEEIELNVGSLNVGNTIDDSSDQIQIQQNARAAVSKPALKTNFRLYGSPKRILFVKSYDNSKLKIENGLLKPVSSGKAKVNVKFVYENGKSVAVDYKLTVGKGNQNIIVADVFNKKYEDKSFSLNAKTTGDGRLSYSSSNTKTAAVDSSGKVTIKNSGTVLLKIQAAETSKYKSASKTVKLIIQPKKAVQTKPKKKVVKKPKKAVLLKLTSPKKKILKITWKKDKEVKGYQIYVAKNKKFSKSKKYFVKSYKTTSKKVTKLSRKKYYYVKIRSYKLDGNKKVYGSFSKVKRIKIK
ncbi:hypothetical protein [Anaerostipes sp.]|uniref:hypothetical protein n=1 Tax=Anaerostipes sp. TaxID=1872530 RepID=UPI0025C29FB1|nr:hypothetical protein [Anaerostipes sp.]MBS7008419.1 hypothetical protein [Anaerostipes sp.]